MAKFWAIMDCGRGLLGLWGFPASAIVESASRGCGEDYVRWKGLKSGDGADKTVDVCKGV